MQRGVEGARGLFVRQVAQGVEHISFRLLKPEPLIVQVLKLPRRLSKGIALQPILANINSLGLQPIHAISKLAQATTGSRVVGAVNGGFFMAGTGTYRMCPVGLLIIDGELITPPNSRSALILWNDGTIGIERVSGSISLQLGDGRAIPVVALNQGLVANGVSVFTPRFGQSTLCPNGNDIIQIVAKARNMPLRPNGSLEATVTSITGGGDIPIPNDCIVIAVRGNAVSMLKDVRVGDELRLVANLQLTKTGVVWALGAGPRLLRDGAVSLEWVEENFKRELLFDAYPRTAVGLNDDSVFLVAVEGDRIRGGRGIDALSLAQLLLGLGCKDALMLDGGTSTSMCIDGEVITPSDGVPRPIANAVLVHDFLPLGEPVRIVIEPSIIHALPKARIPLKLWLEDEAYHRMPLRAPIVFEVSDAIVKVEGNASPTLSVAESPPLETPKEVLVRAKEVGSKLAGEARVLVHKAPEMLTIIPNRIFVEPNETVKLRLLAETSDGYELHYDPSSVSATLDPSIATFNADKLMLIAGSTVGSSKLSIELFGVRTQASVHVGKLWKVIEEFESLTDITTRCVPNDGSVSARVELVNATAFSGNSALRFTFNLSGASGTQAAYIVLNRLVGAPIKLRCAVYGDGSGVWFRAQLKDAKGVIHRLTLANSINWSGKWRVVECAVPSNAVPPLLLDSIYVVSVGGNPVKGSILVDQISAQYPHGE
jgi:exopolysaccharide biosynthesis protein